MSFDFSSTVLPRDVQIKRVGVSKLGCPQACPPIVLPMVYDKPPFTTIFLSDAGATPERDLNSYVKSFLRISNVEWIDEKGGQRNPWRLKRAYTRVSEWKWSLTFKL